MADEFITVPIDVEPTELQQLATDYIQTQFPDWNPDETKLETRLIGALARIASELMTVLSDVPADIFRYFGAKLVGLIPIDAIPATMPTTWTMIDNLGHTIEEGTTIGGRDEGGNLVTFVVDAEVVVPAGQLATGAGAVLVRATSDGSASNDIDDPLELVDSANFVESVVATAPSANGVDAESNEEYLDRLAAELELLTPRPILPDDFAVMARRIGGVERAVAIDGYNPTGPLTNQERTVSVAAVDEEGEAVAAGIKTAIDTLLEAEREVNFDVFVIDPTYSIMDVTFTVRAHPGQDIVTLEAEAEQIVADYFDPANWGQGNLLESSASRWSNITTVRHAELLTLLNNIPAVNYVESLTFAIQGNALGTADVVLPGPAPLTRAGAINGTVNAA